MVLKPTHADDVGLYSNIPEQNQKSILIFLDALEWSKCFVLRVNKCRSSAAMLFTKKQTQFKPHMKKRYSSFDPELSVRGEFIIFIGHDVGKSCMFKYLGHWTQDDFGIDRIVKVLDKRIKDWIEIIDASLLTGPMKCWILNTSVYSKAQWMLMVHDFRLGQIDKWQNLFHRKFRKWMGLAKF